MDKITYLIGAGASKSTIPIMAEFSDKLKELHDEFAKNKEEIILIYPISQQRDIEKAFGRILKDCLDFQKEMFYHGTIDSLAYKFFKTDQYSEFIRLKAIISLIVIYNTFKNPINRRYDNFFQNIMHNKYNGFKNDYRVVSWNYDFLFEKAYSIYSKEKRLSKNQQLLHVNQAGIFGNQPVGSFKLFKINGTTSFYNPTESRFSNITDDLEIEDNVEILYRLIGIYDQSTWENESYISDITFAFEEKFEKDESHIISTVLKEIVGSKSLIVIGYSFPDVNTQIDRQIFEILFERVQKIYIQNPEGLDSQVAKITKISKFYDSMFCEESSNKFYVPPL